MARNVGISEKGHTYYYDSYPNANHRYFFNGMLGWCYQTWVENFTTKYVRGDYFWGPYSKTDFSRMPDTLYLNDGTAISKEKADEKESLMPTHKKGNDNNNYNNSSDGENSEGKNTIEWLEKAKVFLGNLLNDPAKRTALIGGGIITVLVIIIATSDFITVLIEKAKKKAKAIYINFEKAIENLELKGDV